LRSSRFTIESSFTGCRTGISGVLCLDHEGVLGIVEGIITEKDVNGPVEVEACTNPGDMKGWITGLWKGLPVDMPSC
jgi:hypothetical protein